MNITEAIHTQTLLTWLTDPHLLGDEHADIARDAAAVLATAARRRLGAGPSRDQITEAWPALLTGCAGCPTCTPDTAAPSDDAAASGDWA
jgi:hypothetical protein